MKGLVINVYDKADRNNVVKTVEAEPADLMFGSIRSIMKLLNIDDINDTGELLKTVYDAWDQLTGILNECFPEMEDKDWDNVKLNELIPVIVTILKVSFGKVLDIPGDPKN